MTTVLAMHNRGEWNYVAEDEQDAYDRMGDEIDAGQCDACGSFTEDGEIGPGFILGLRLREKGAPIPNLVATCGCCGEVRRVAWKDEDEVVF